MTLSSVLAVVPAIFLNDLLRYCIPAVLRSLTTAVHNDMHHDQMHGNYGLYFRFWDQWMGTENPLYEERFKEISARGARSRGAKS